MTEVYSGSELQAELAYRKRFRIIFYSIFGVVAAIDAACVVFAALLPYKSPLAVYPKLVAYGVSALFIVLSYPFLAIKYRRLRAYIKLLTHLSSGLKEGSKGELISFSKDIEVREGVDFRSLNFYEYNDFKKGYFVRKVLLDAEKPRPEINPGEIVHYLTQGNVLMSYRILPRPEGEPTSEQKRQSVAKKDKKMEFAPPKV